MSHSNEQCAADLRDAWQEGYADAIAVLPQVTVILQDLIAEIRERHGSTFGDTCPTCHARGGKYHDPAPCPDSLAADRAEARLRKATQ